jgi:carbonic anhydrase
MSRSIGAPPRFGDPTTASAALAGLIAGNERFRIGAGGAGLRTPAAHAAEQRPIAAVFTCLDSRVGPEVVFDQPLGALVVVRVGAHVLDSAAEASLIFAVEALNVPLVLVLGHQYCAAVDLAARAVRTGVRPAGFLASSVAPSIDLVDGEHEAVVDSGVRRHTIRTVERLREVLAQQGAVAEVIGARYAIDTGRIDLI